MKKNYVLMFLFVTILLMKSCVESKNKKLSLTSTNYNFILEDGEFLIEKSLKTITKYDSLFNSNQNFQNPLLYHVKHDEYEFFIGIPINTSVRYITNNISDNIDTTFCNMIFENQTLFINCHYNNVIKSEYYREFQDGVLVSVSAIYNCDTCFSKENIDKRFVIKK